VPEDDPDEDPEDDPLEEPVPASSLPPELEPDDPLELPLASSPNPPPPSLELLEHEGSRGKARAPTMANEIGHKRSERSVTETSTDKY